MQSLLNVSIIACYFYIPEGSSAVHNLNDAMIKYIIIILFFFVQL